jgi:hypothetical protein
LSTDQLKFTVHWYIDGLHQIHKDCRGQMGSLVTFGKGAIASSSSKMKCSTKSSSETELVSLVDKLRDIVWKQISLNAKVRILTNTLFFKTI